MPSEVAHECLEGVLVRALEKDAPVPVVILPENCTAARVVGVLEPGESSTRLSPTRVPQVAKILDNVRHVDTKPKRRSAKRKVPTGERSKKGFTKSGVTGGGWCLKCQFWSPFADKFIVFKKGDVLTALWFQATTVAELSWTVAATNPIEAVPMTFAQAISQASRALDAAWGQKQITKPEIINALKPICRFTSAFVTEEEITEDAHCFSKHPDYEDPPLFGINGKGLARLTALVRGFWIRRSQVALFQIASLNRSVYFGLPCKTLKKF